MPNFERKYLKTLSSALYLDRYTAVIWPIFITALYPLFITILSMVSALKFISFNIHNGQLINSLAINMMCRDNIWWYELNLGEFLDIAMDNGW